MEFDWFVADIGGQALAGESVVLVTLLIALLEVNDFEIVGIGRVVWDKVDENSLLLTLAVEEKLDVLVKITPLLGLLWLL